MSRRPDVLVADTRLAPVLDPWVQAGVLGPAEVHTACALARLGGETDPRVVLAAAFAVWAPLHGHVCVPLAELHERIREALVEDPPERAGAGEQAVLAHDVDALPALPDPNGWRSALLASPLVRAVAGYEPDPPLDGRPLVLAGDRLYLQRQWVDECTVASGLLRLADATCPPAPPGASKVLDRVLPTTGDDDAQARAARAVLARSLTVVAGGPGTGKTTTVARLLAAFVTDPPGDGRSPRRGPRLALAAPTGKAATRLTDAVHQAVDRAEADRLVTPAAAARLRQLEASTIHRLLGPRDGRLTRFRHDRTTPLPYDVVVVDESSMVALPLMARLLEAIRPDARLVLVGDPGQLESVEVGAVLADVCAAAAEGGPLAGVVTELRRPHRVEAGSALGPLADAVRRGDDDDVMLMLRAGAPGVAFVEHDDPLADPGGAGIRSFAAGTLREAVDAARRGDAGAALGALSTVRVLCAHRNGRHGVALWNRQLEAWSLDAPGPGVLNRWYAGRPVLVTRNDLRTGLVNGDTGIVVQDPGGPPVVVVARVGTPRRLAPSQLDAVETCFAMTVHKSQGSEYPHVALVLAPASSPLLTRELLYTAITRAKSSLLVVGTEAAVRRAVRSASGRASGLRHALS